MTQLKLTNTLGGKLEPFEPIEDGYVRMYTCGLTVYNRGHIGNFRTFVSQDILRRYLQYKGFNVTQAMNFTDVDDKTIAGAREGRRRTSRVHPDLHRLLLRGLRDPQHSKGGALPARDRPEVPRCDGRARPKSSKSAGTRIEATARFTSKWTRCRTTENSRASTSVA